MINITHTAVSDVLYLSSKVNNTKETTMSYYKITVKSSGKPHCIVASLYRAGQELEALAYDQDYCSDTDGVDHEAMISYLADKLSDSRQHWSCETVTDDEYIEAPCTYDWTRTIEKSV